MSGHSKWKTNKGKKMAADAVKGATYTKLIKEIVVVAREGGGDPGTNFKLRAIMVKAKEANMPSENVKTAIKRGTGELPGIIYESVTYEGYGPGGVALLIETLTDNKNRASAEIRNIMSKKGANMAGAGSVSWMFTRKGYIMVEKAQAKEDDLMGIVIDAGAEDMKSEGKNYEIFTAPQNLENVKAALQAKGVQWAEAEVTMVPSSTVKVTGDVAKQLISLIETLEEHDDVQEVSDNSEIPDEVMEQLSSES
jgi:YebC/PmpR family DNA-binding regulatory protein